MKECIGTDNIYKCWRLSIRMCQSSSTNDKMMRAMVYQAVDSVGDGIVSDLVISVMSDRLANPNKCYNINLIRINLFNFCRWERKRRQV